ncbi:MAG: methyltransferase [Deltaproteobacteria bacterium]|nr:methyltransferase [Deltaproteobacteria bacterium]
MTLVLGPHPVDQVSPRGGILRAARRPDGWQATGPAPLVPDDLTELWPRPDEDLCWLAGNWRILQRTDGHRTSLDDLLVAHLAASLLPEEAPLRCLDLGCGIGSVLLFLAWRFPRATFSGVEVQAVSAELARRSLRWNGVAARAAIHTGDFRDEEVLTGEPPYELVTGTPPYFPIGAGPESDHVQRAPCRFEHHGGIEAYSAAAGRRLAAGAPFVACEAWNQRERVEPAARAAGLRLVRWREVVPRAGKEPLLCIFAMRAADRAEALAVWPPLVVRDRHGRRTPEFSAIRRAMGMPA